MLSLLQGRLAERARPARNRGRGGRGRLRLSVRHQGAAAKQLILASRGGIFVDFETGRIGRGRGAAKDVGRLGVTETRDTVQAAALRDRTADTRLVQVHDGVAALESAGAGGTRLDGCLRQQVGAVALEGTDESLVRRARHVEVEAVAG